MVHSHHGIVLNDKKEGSADARNESDESPGNYSDVSLIIKGKSEVSTWGWKCFVT